MHLLRPRERHSRAGTQQPSSGQEQGGGAKGRVSCLITRSPPGGGAKPGGRGFVCFSWLAAALALSRSFSANPCPSCILFQRRHRKSLMWPGRPSLFLRWPGSPPTRRALGARDLLVLRGCVDVHRRFEGAVEPVELGAYVEGGAVCDRGFGGCRSDSWTPATNLARCGPDLLRCHPSRLSRSDRGAYSEVVPERCHLVLFHRPTHAGRRRCVSG